MNTNTNVVTDTAQVDHEMADAYADCHLHPSSGRRNLDWKASSPVPAETAVAMFMKYVGAYNDFSYDVLEDLPTDALVWPAREGSVCVYVKFTTTPDDRTVHRLARSMHADEVHTGSDGLVRFWWD